MSGFLALVAQEKINSEDHDWLVKARDEITKICPASPNTWNDDKIIITNSLLTTTDDTIAEILPYTFDDNLYISGDILINNRQELIEKLSGSYENISDKLPDSYLVLHAYSLWQEQCIEHFSGDFAFAIWNKDTRSLFCARDHLGVVPFYYAQWKNRFIVSNFYRALETIPGLTDDLNEDMLRDCILIGTSQSFTETLYANIHKLPPAHCLTYKNSHFHIYRYWEPAKRIKPVRYNSTTEYAAHFKGLFYRSVNDRLRISKAGVHLSGGMDSSSITAAAQTILKEKYDDAHTLKAYNLTYRYLITEKEGQLSQLTSQHLGVPLEQLIMEDYLKNTGEGNAYWTPEPKKNADGSADAAIMRKVSEYAPVLFTGHGGDQVLAYDTGYWLKLLKQGNALIALRDFYSFVVYHWEFPLTGLAKKWKKIRKKSAFLSDVPDIYNNNFLSHDAAMARLIAVSHKQTRGADGLSKNLYWSNLCEISHPGFSGMQVKIRFPFINKELAEFVRSSPPYLFRYKSILRLAMYNVLPAKVINRPKTVAYGFAHWKNLLDSGSLDLLKKEVLASPGLKSIIDQEKLEKFINNKRAITPANHRYFLQLLYYVIWQKQLASKSAKK